MPATTPSGTTSRPAADERQVQADGAAAAEPHDEVALADEAVLVEVGDRVDDREPHDQAVRAPARPTSACHDSRCGVQVEAAEDHPGPVRQGDDQLAEAAVGPADRRRHVEDRRRAAEQREGEDRPAARDRQVDADGERAREGGDAEPEDGVGHRRQIGGVEDPVGAHARVEILVEGLDADDREHHAGEAAEEDRARRTRRRGRRPRPRRAGTEAGPRRGRSGSAPARRRAARRCHAERPGRLLGRRGTQR